MDEKIRQGDAEARALSRRDLIRGTAVAGLVIGADSYVKPALKLVGVTRLNAAASAPGGNNNQGGGNNNNQQVGRH